MSIIKKKVQVSLSTKDGVFYITIWSENGHGVLISTHIANYEAIAISKELDIPIKSRD